jgi:intracellular septation protein
MAALSEFLPLLLFFAAFKVFGIFAATGVAMATIAFQVGMKLVKGQKVDPMLWVTAIVVAVFGGATLFFRDDTFIKWKPTILYWCGALALVVAHFGFKKNFLRDALSKNFDAPDWFWTRLAFAWVGFLITLGVVNLYVARNFSSETWVTYKVFGTLVLMIVFIGAQTALLWRYAKQPTEPGSE